MSDSSDTPPALRSFDETQRAESADSEPSGRMLPSASASGAGFDQGTVLGRYVLLERLGQGGGGTVFAAYDPKLDRKVALKLVRGQGPKDVERLLIEAQAMAKVEDRNVVAVFDVGEHEDVVFVAMELVVGRTMDRWTQRAPRGWAEVVAAYRDAGSGLAAVHEAGLVHGDFKPQNVLVSELGHIKVADFGLARASRDTSATQIDGDAESLPFIVGTPAYMSPEQFQGARPTAASDQFSFCVALHEALLRVRPFAGKDLAQLKRAVVTGQRTNPPRQRIPRALLDVVERGLSSNPVQRHASMRNLLAALDRVMSAARRKTAMWAGGGIATTMGVLYFAAPQDDPCMEPEATLVEAWSNSRGSIATAFANADAGIGAASWSGTEEHIDGYIARFSDATAQLCEGEWTPAPGEPDREQRVACLSGAANQATSLLAEFVEPDATAIRMSAAASLSLSDPERCVNDSDLPLLPADMRPELASARDAFARTRVQLRTGDFRAALATTETYEDLSQRAPRLHVLFLRERGRALLLAGQLESAQAVVDEAMRKSAELHDDFLTLALWLDTVELTIRAGGKGRDDLYRPVEMAMIAAGRPASMELPIADGLTRLAIRRSDFELAEASVRRVLELAERDDVPGLQVSTALANSTSVLNALGHYEQSRTVGLDAVALHAKLLGEGHPHTALIRNNVAVACQSMGDYDCALEQHLAALETELVALGPSHPQVGLTRYNIAVTHQERGELDLAETFAESAETIWRSAPEPDRVRLAALSVLRSNIAAAGGDFEATLRYNEAAIQEYREVGGPQDARVARQLGSRASTLLEMQQHDEALGACDQALEIWAAVDRDHPDSAFALVSKARALRELGRPADAVTAAHRAVVVRTAASDAPRRIAYAQYEEARCRWAADEDRPRALELARAAAETYGTDGSEYARKKRTEIESWLSTVTGS